ncbi:hypothetical protein [Numidum massiliense]|uniref:hypothetical protein n=1 Tax=Numidum massiliense TaxID=1522315 RepID=UPI001E2F203E|nr:hypothetical protein [Numidum massiliense]
MEPEVAGGHGEKTVYGTVKDGAVQGVSDKVNYLHYEFEGWLGDDLLESAPCFIISKQLEEKLVESTFRDYRLEDCLITTSDAFHELYPDRELPPFRRFIPLGTVDIEGETFKNWSGHHFCLSPKGELVVTVEALSFLKKILLNNCDVTDLSSPEY